MDMLVTTDRPMMPAAKGTSGYNGCDTSATIRGRPASAAAGSAATSMCHHFTPNQPTRIAASAAAKSAVTIHFADQITYHAPSVTSGLPQLAKTSTATIEAK